MLAVLAALFVLSGAAGLFYEAVWSRYLSLFVGHDAYAQILTLVMFLGGMGLGALIVSRRTTRIKDPLFAYAIVEAVIGLLGLAFHDVIYLPTTTWAYEHLFPGLGGGVSVVLSKATLIEPGALPERITRRRREPLVAERSSPNPSLEVIERAYIMWVLQAEGGNKTRAAEVLGIDPSTLYRKLSRYEEQPAAG